MAKDCLKALHIKMSHHSEVISIGFYIDLNITRVMSETLLLHLVAVNKQAS